MTLQRLATLLGGISAPVGGRYTPIRNIDAKYSGAMKIIKQLDHISLVKEHLVKNGRIDGPTDYKS